MKCRSISCINDAASGFDFCYFCGTANNSYKVTDEMDPSGKTPHSPDAELDSSRMSMSDKYPQYYKSVGDMTEVDVYAVHHLFNINDPSGCIQHASKKLLLSGVRTGGKSAFKDIQEARDTLTRWLQLNHAE